MNPNMDLYTKTRFHRKNTKKHVNSKYKVVGAQFLHFACLGAVRPCPLLVTHATG